MPAVLPGAFRCGAAALLIVIATPAPSNAQLQTRSLQKIADGVYAVIYSEMKQDPVQSNALIVIGSEAVAVVDAHYTPSAARATIASIRQLTPLPVRYVVTSHWHDDHVFGNQEYRAAFPEVIFIAQEQTRTLLLQEGEKHRQQLASSYGKAVARVSLRLERGTSDSGVAISATDRQRYNALLPLLRAYLADFQAVVITPPDSTFAKSLTLHLGGREVQLIAFGAGNTEGDVVVWLPAERIAAVGDLLVYPVPFIYGGFPASWVAVLDSVRQLAPLAIVPGHGPVFHDFAYLNQVSCLLGTLATQARVAVAKQQTFETARSHFDVAALRSRFTGIDPSRGATFDSSILEAGLQAAFDEASALTVGSSGHLTHLCV